MTAEPAPFIERRRAGLWAQTLVETMPQLVWTANSDGECDHVGHQWVAFTGVPEAEQIGNGWLAVIHPDDRGSAGARWTKAVRDRRAYDSEYRIRRYDGVFRWFKTRGVPQFSPRGEIVKWLGTCVDIDDQKNAEARFSSLLANVSDALFVIGRDWRYVFVNPPGARFANLSPAEMVGRTVWEVFPQERTARFEIEATRAFETGKEVHYESEHRDTGRSFETDIFPGGGNIVVIARDITARREFERQLQQSAKLESLGVLAGGVAHDFNNLLAVIMGNIGLALDMGPESPAIRSVLQDAISASERAALLVRQLLAYAGKGHFHLEPVEVPALVRDAVRLAESHIPAGVRIHVELADGLPPVQGDFAQLQQALMNLIVNAAESYGDGKSGEVRLTVALLQITDSPELAGGRYISLRVEDDGCGMDEETAKRVFDPFFSTKFTGRGLGLAAVQGIVRSHKGGLRVESSPGKGSRFIVSLPVSTPEPS